ncbi:MULTISPECIES: WhiB family transcriptional regulator [unclassified Streptomyces]|uniref:WhiB family transcriptional regulator n=1 Tax=unclassified Streptomyces TaxID=2593676 RepID=UPI00332CAEE5
MRTDERNSGQVMEEAFMEWAQRAACVDEDPELFFPLSSTGPALRQELAAKRVCLRCPVIRQCLDWAMGSGQVHGVWGGTSERERAELHRTTALVTAHERTR